MLLTLNVTTQGGASQCNSPNAADTPRTKKRKAQDLLRQKQNTGHYFLRSGQGDLLGEENYPQSTDSPFRWAKRQAKSTQQPTPPVSSSPPPAPTAATHTTIEVDAAGDQRATAEDVVVVLTREALQPSTDAAAERTHMHACIHSSNWSEAYYAVESFRRLCLHHPEQIFDDLQHILPAVCESAKALRSAVARNSLMALSDVFLRDHSRPNPMTYCTDAMLELVVSTLLEQGAADKSFLRKEANIALHQLTLLSETDGRIFHAIAQHVHHKRPKIPGLVGKYGMCSLQSTPISTAGTSSSSTSTSTSSSSSSSSVFTNDILHTMLRTFSTLLTAKDPEGRTGGRQGLEHLYSRLGKATFVSALKAAVPVHELEKATRAAGIVRVKVVQKRMSLKEKMRLAKLKMKKMNVVAQGGILE